MVNIEKEIKESEKYVSQLEKEIYSFEFEKAQYQKAIKRALKKKSFKEKCILIFNIFLEKLGRIPYCQVEEYRTDTRIRELIQSLRNELILLDDSIIDNKTLPDQKYDITSVENDKKGKDERTTLKKSGYIAFVVNSLDCGGLEQIVALLAEHLFEKEIALKVLCLDEGGLIADQLKDKGIEVLIFHGNGKAFRNFIRKNPPRIVNTHYVKRHIKFLYKQNIPVIEVIHNMYVFYCQHVAKIERRNEKYFSRLIAVSKLVKDTYCEQITKTDKITVIGNAAILRESPRNDRKKMRKLLGIPQDAYVILNVGSIDPRKNQLGILTAYNLASKLTNVPLYLVFAGNVQDEKYNQKLVNTIEKCENKSNVIHMSYYERIRELYGMADVFILDSYYEGWSIAATESLYEGTPIIHSMCGSAFELTANGKFGMVIPNPAGDLSEVNNSQLGRIIIRGENRNMKETVAALLSMINNRQYWMKHRVDISEEARRNYSIESFIHNYMDEFEKTEERGI